MSKKLLSVLLAGALLISSPLRGEDTDPEAKAVREVGKAYAVALTNGDRDAMRKCFDSTDAEVAVADSMFDMMQTAKTFRETMIKQFGDDAMKSDKGEFNADKILSQMDAMQVKVTGDTAMLTNNNAKSGLTFKKVSTAWKLTSVTGNPMATAMMPHMLSAAIKVTTDITTDVAAGKYKTVEEVKKDVNTRTQAAIKAALSTPIAPPTTQKAAN